MKPLATCGKLSTASDYDNRKGAGDSTEGGGCADEGAGDGAAGDGDKGYGTSTADPPGALAAVVLGGAVRRPDRRGAAVPRVHSGRGTEAVRRARDGRSVR